MAEIVLAGEKHEIQRLNLGQIEEIADALGPPQPGKPPRTFQRSLEIVSAALKASGRADLTPDVLRGMAITPDEIRAAQDVVLKHSGLIPAGEAQAPAPVAPGAA